MSSSSASFFTLFTSDDAGLRTRLSTGAALIDISVAEDFLTQDSSSPLQFAPRATFEHEIFNSRDLSKKGLPPRRLAYAARTASKAIALFAQ